MKNGEAARKGLRGARIIGRSIRLPIPHSSGGAQRVEVYTLRVTQHQESRSMSPSIRIEIRQRVGGLFLLNTS
jgi:hypothetical protein